MTTAGLIAGLALAGPLAAQEAQQPAPGTEAPAPGTEAPEAGAPADAAAAPAEAADYDASTVLATVNGTDITLGHVVVLRERLPQQFQSLPDETLFQGLVDQLVDQALLAETLAGPDGEDPLPVRLHIENERRGTLAARAVSERFGAGPSDEEVQAAYDAAMEGFQRQPEFNASHIIVPTEEAAAALKAELDAGADFAELAKEHSTDGAAANGGSLGWFGPGQMVPEFEQAVGEMEVGEVRGPVETQFGWHLIRLDDERETQPPALEEVRPQLVEQIRQQRLTEELERLRSEAEIERPETGIPPSAIRDTGILDQ